VLHHGRLRALPLVGLVVVGFLALAALGALLFSHDQSRVAQFIEVTVTLGGAASSLAGWLLTHLRSQAQAQAAGSVTGLSLAVPAGALPTVVRGRDEVIAQLRRLPRKRERGPAVLAGPGGVGKSTIAASFAVSSRQARAGLRRRYVWWVTATDLSSLTGGLVSVARQLGGSQADLEVIRTGGPDGPDRLWSLLANSDRRWLLVFDNADDPRVLGRPAGLSARGVPAWPGDGTGWVRPARRGLVIVTTRDGDRAVWGRDARILPVEPLGEREAAMVLLDCAPEAGSLAEARQLARRVGCLPLPLQLAGSYLASDAALRRSFDDYVRALDGPGQRPRLLSLRPGMGPPADPRSVVMLTWEMSLDKLAQRGIPQARAVLRLLSCFAWATPVPCGILASATLDRPLADHGRGVQTRGLPEHDLEDALHGLSALGLVDIRPFGGNGTGGNAVVVQPVIADVSRAHLAAARDGTDSTALIRRAAIEIMVSAVNRLDADRNADWPDYLALGPHLHALLGTVARRADRRSLADLVTATMMAADAHSNYGDIPAGERLSCSAAGAAARLGGDDPIALRARHQRAWFLAKQERWADAEDMYRDVLDGFRRVLGEDHPDTLCPCHELAWVAACQQRWPEAETSYRHVLAARSRVLGADHRVTLITRHELGWAIANQGREQVAEPMLRDVLLTRQRVLGEHDRRTLMTRLDLAWIAARTGKLDAAEAAYREIVRSCRDLLRSDHPDTLTAWHELAWVLALSGRRRPAIREYRAVLAARTRVLGDSHPDTAATREALKSLQQGVTITPCHIV
jgi:tetratricopeptide (TPR) repeat protein